MRALLLLLAALAAFPAAAPAAQDDENVVWFVPADSLLGAARAAWEPMGTPVAAFDTLLNVLLPPMRRALAGDEPRTGVAGGVRPFAIELLPGGSVVLGVTLLGPRPDLGFGGEVNRLGLAARMMASEHGARAVGVLFDGRGTFTDDLFGPALVAMLGDADGHNAFLVLPIDGATEALGAPRWRFGSPVFYDLADVLPPDILGTAWPPLPARVVSGRLATPADVADGTAVFALNVTGGAAAPAEVLLPQYAVMVEDGRFVPGVLVQAEEALGIRSAAFRPVGGAPTIVPLDLLILLGQEPPAP